MTPISQNSVRVSLLSRFKVAGDDGDVVESDIADFIKNVIEVVRPLHETKMVELVFTHRTQC